MTRKQPRKPLAIVRNLALYTLDIGCMPSCAQPRSHDPMCAQGDFIALIAELGQVLEPRAPKGMPKRTPGGER